jgi:hypothetical protein
MMMMVMMKMGGGGGSGGGVYIQTCRDEQAGTGHRHLIWARMTGHGEEGGRPRERVRGDGRCY